MGQGAAADEGLILDRKKSGEHVTSGSVDKQVVRAGPEKVMINLTIHDLIVLKDANTDVRLDPRFPFDRTEPRG
jgi:hypothetical protein